MLTTVLAKPQKRRRRQLPTGALGVWYMDQYQASPRPYVPNALSTAAVVGNLIAAPRRLFNMNVFWTKAGVTMTDSAGTAPDGSADASQLVGTGSWWLLVAPANALALPSGTYTVAGYVKSNTGSSQTFRLTSVGNFHDSAALTATTAWQRFSYSASYTTSTDQPGIRAISGGASNDLLICDLEMYAGAADLGPQAYGGHLYLGKNALNAPTVASGAVDLSTDQYGLAQFAAAQTFSAYTVLAVLAPQSDGGSRFVSFFTKAGPGGADYLNFSANYAFDGLIQMKFDGTSQYGWVGTNLDDQFNGMGYHCWGHRWTGTGTKPHFWLDDLRFYTPGATVTRSNVTLTDALVGISANVGNYGNYKLAALAVWRRALSDAEMQTAYGVLKARAALNGNTITAPTKVYCADGDSITATQTYCYPYKLIPNAVTGTYVSNMAVSGYGIVALTAKGTDVDALLPTSRTGRTFVLSVLIGANDLAGTFANNAAGYIAALAAYCDARRAAGWKLVVATILPTNQGNNFNTTRATVNTAIRTWVSSHADGIADFAADATMGTDAAASNTTYYAGDGIHPTDAGHAILAPIMQTAIEALL